MVVLVRCCCCGCDLSTGVFLLAVLSAVGGGYGIYSNFNSASTLTRFREDLMENPELHSLLPVPLKYYDVVTNLLKTDGVFNIIVVLTSLLLLGAHNSKNRFLALPYLAWHAILLVYNLGVTIFYIIIWKGFAVIGIAIFNAIFWVLSIYFLIVVYSFHEALREDPSGVSAGYRPPNRPGQAASGPPVAAAQMYKPDV
ncbi:uncharacterized protein [Montipora capricornis]|uniref:uncharacterized protein n=1 Tax=Montipora capricornis TaxID=246305 RepID=UPI0035F1995B